MSILRTTLLMTLLVAASAAHGPAYAVEVRGIRYSSTGERTRVVVDLDGPATYQHWTLGDPPRVLVGLPEASVSEGLLTPAIHDGFVDRVRINAPRDGRVQIVLDLRVLAEYRTFTLDNPSRIVIDVLHDGATPPPRSSDPPAGEKPPPDGGEESGDRKPVAERSPAEKVPADEKAAENPAGEQTADSSPPPPETAAASDPRADESQTPSTGGTVIAAKPPLREGPWRIAIDAGHGGKDPGAAYHGAREKDIVLALARAACDELNGRPGVEAFLVRKGDYYIPLRRRWTIAEEGGADLFVSLHCDAAPRNGTRGTAVYFLSLKGATDEAARELAERENRYDRELGLTEPEGELETILFDMGQTDVLAKSEMLAETALDRLFALGTVYSRGVKQAGFAVLKSPRMPSVLVEAAFISNPDENRLLRDRKWQKNFGRYLADGIAAYCRNVERAE
jgi:N-acetylmuramoyl-L-alanine amidase